MAIAKGLNVILKGPLVLEVRAADAVPELAAVLLVGPPVAPHGEGLAALPAREGPDPVLPLVMRLQGPEILERLGSWVIDVVPAPRRAAIAWKSQHSGGLSSPERLWPLSIREGIERAYLHVVVSVEGLEANRTFKLGWANENLRRSRNPILAFVELVHHIGKALNTTIILFIFINILLERKGFSERRRRRGSLGKVKSSRGVWRRKVVEFEPVLGVEVCVRIRHGVLRKVKGKGETSWLGVRPGID
nr:hypothetical protein DM860_009871 [Ipomoea batatas]